MKSRAVQLAGNPAPIRVAVEQSRAINDSPEFTAIYRGEINAMHMHWAGQFGRGQQPIRAHFRQDGAAASSQFTYKELEEIEEHVEIDFEEVQRPWFTSPHYATLDGGDIAFVEGLVKGHLEYLQEERRTQAEAAADLLAAVNAAGGAGSLKGDAIEDLLLNGDVYTAFLPHITYTRNVAPNYGVPYVTQNIGQVFSTAAMGNEIPLSLFILFGLSDILNTVTANELQAVGWLKRGRMGYASDGGAQYISTYRFDAYPTNRYTFV